jgi:nucleoside-diphosphate-sugar epimerase
MNIDKTKPVLVTGGNGYIASWLVKYLLEEGCNVRATVRDPSNEKKVGHLKRIAAKTPGKLTLFQADLLQAGAFNGPMKGCELVFHTASPFVIMGIKDAQKELVDPAVQGTRNVLEAANRNDSVRRVVLTSSVVAIYGDAQDIRQTQGGVFTEGYWNTTSSVEHQPYNYSKVAAEKVAWEMARAQNRWDLVVINPGLVLGPSLTNTSDSTSLSTMLQFVDGTLKMGAPKLEFGVVDVRDVALAHIKAGFTPTASGRHICVSDSISMLAMGKLLMQHFGKRYHFPRREIPKFLVWLVAPMSGLTRQFVSTNVGYPLKFDNGYTRKDLGIDFRPVEQTLVEHFQQMIEDGIIRDKRA